MFSYTKKDGSGRSLVELITLWLAIFILVGLLLGRANIVLRRTNEAALKNELESLRLAVMLHKILNRAYPQTLEELVGKDYTIFIKSGLSLKEAFLRRYKYAECGRLKDPFGEIYLYNPNTGMVKSQSKGYEDW